MLWRIFTSVGVWIITTLVAVLLGAFLATLGQEVTNKFAQFLTANSMILGFVVGLIWFFFGNGYWDGHGWARRDRP